MKILLHKIAQNKRLLIYKNGTHLYLNSIRLALMAQFAQIFCF